jgi:hypothetical protein
MAAASRARSLYCTGHYSPRLVRDVERRWHVGRPVWVVCAPGRFERVQRPPEYRLRREADDARGQGRLLLRS